MFAILHLTPGSQVNLFEEIWRILEKDGLFIMTAIKDAPSYFKKVHEGEKVRLGMIDGFIRKDKRCY